MYMEPAKTLDKMDYVRYLPGSQSNSPLYIYTSFSKAYIVYAYLLINWLCKILCAFLFSRFFRSSAS